MGTNQTKQTKIGALNRTNGQKYGYWPDRTDRNMAIGQLQQTIKWVLPRPKRTKDL